MNKSIQLDIRRIKKDSLYPSERRKRIDKELPINELLRKEKSTIWMKLLKQYGILEKNEYLNYFGEEDKASGIFTTFYPAFLRIAEDYLEAELNTIENISLISDIETLKNNIMEFISENIAYLCVRVLIQDINELREESRLIGNTSEERYEYYINHILSKSNKQHDILQRYPVLARILFETIVLYTNSIIEAISHFSKDRSELVQTFNLLQEDYITTLSLQLGDTHNNGRSVILFQLSSGKKIVYKPRSLSIDQHFQELLAWINHKNTGLPLKTITILDRGSYGWQEYVEHVPCRSKEEVSRFYERQGYYLAILYILNATDFHYENLIANGENPMLIDLEGLIQNTNKNLNVDSSAYARAFKKLMDSVLSIGMLPVSYIKSNILGFDFSGLGGDEGQDTGHETFSIENTHTDKMKLVKVAAFSEASKNRPFKEDKNIDVSQFNMEIIKGFQEIYTLLLEHKNELLSSNGPLSPFKNDSVRVILRSTQIYATFIDSSYHPDYLTDGDSRERLVNLLWTAKKNNPDFEDIIMYECRDVLKGDIPYFYCYTNSRDLYHPLGKVKSDYYNISNFDCLMERIGTLSITDMKEQLSFIENSLIAQYSNHNHQSNETIRDYSNNSPIELLNNTDQFLELAQLVGNDLKNDAIIGEDNDITWLGMNLSMNDQLMFSPVESDLYDGLLGIGLFYANLYRVTQNEENKVLAEKCIQTAVKNLNYEQLPLSTFYGYGAYAYALGNYSIIFQDKKYLLEAKNILTKSTEQIISDEALDFMGGSAGLIITCINLYKKTGESYLLEIAKTCGESLLLKSEKQATGIAWRSNQLGKPLAGLSHGSSGFSWALAELYSFTNDNKYMEALQESLKYERSLYNKKQQNWLDLRDGVEKFNRPMWCHGASGIGMSRLMIRNNLPKNQEIENEIKIALAKTKKYGFGGTHSLCHGDLGNVDLLLIASEHYQKSGLKELAWKIGEDVALEVKGRETKFGMPSGAKSPGLMVGQAGIGYGFLRLAVPEIIPSVLTLGLSE
ncbi:type 2 lantibiotic biosynthesis protein LanM [Oceanobacillus limi]|uniref:Type 2 lantibiotic biosynthesis protein LanM n=1 Tax=Oceanobacillus limi TaxID=930131 RepID=A0A1I0DMQ3_9BACI|nr:type 2 lanthipeptide synthetase LanM family protein [Oceanobacillus limi]SET33400.1 type 2 lantibiotic biosynthesis protein LanM [Oceanobacillus limi]